MLPSSAMNDQRGAWDYLIVGGGMAGLSAAAHLALSGRRVALLEADCVAGGRFANHGTVAFEHAGQHYTFPDEHGLHGIFHQYRNMRRLMARLGLDRDLRAADGQDFLFQRSDGKVGRVEVGARVRSSRLPDAIVPMGTNLALLREDPSLSLAGHVRALRSMLHALAFDPSADGARYDTRSVADLIDGWPMPQRRLTAALARSGSFAEPEETSLSGFLSGLGFYGLGHKQNSAFDIFPHDSGRDLIEPLCRFIERSAGQVRLGAPVDRLRVEGERAVGVVLSSGEAIDAHSVVLALDPPALSALVERSGLSDRFDLPPFPAGFPSFAVRFWSTRDPSGDRPFTGVFGGYGMDAYFWLHRLQDPFAHFHAQTGGSVLEVHLYADRAKRAAGLSQAELVAELERTLCGLWPGLAGSVVHRHVRRNAARHVAFGPGRWSRLPAVETALPNVALAGDWIACPSPCFHLERATLTGLLAARQLASVRDGHSDGLPVPLMPHEDAPSVAWVRRALRPARDLGLLARLDKPRGHLLTRAARRVSSRPQR